MRALVLVLVLALLSACGAKGPLYLPDDSKQKQQQEKNQK
jgi:predicted small lipoprotein YifL